MSRLIEYSSKPGGGGSDLTGDRHHVVLRGAAPAQHHLVLAGEEPIGGGHWGLLVQDADGAILPNAIGHLVRVHPQGQLAGQQPAQLRLAESDLTGYLADDGVHLVVDTDAAVAGALGGLFRKPVMFVVLCGDRTRGRCPGWSSWVTMDPTTRGLGVKG